LQVGELWEQGVREVMLLGQNVNSYNDRSGNVVEGYDGSWFKDNNVNIFVGEEEGDGDIASVAEGSNGDNRFTSPTILSPGFSTLYKIKEGGLRFCHLLDYLSIRYPEMRFRFTSPHPKDFPDELLYLMRERPNLCNMIHLPAQSGSSTVLERMRRGYTKDAYLECVKRIRTILPDVSISSDFITGQFFL
jgi:tRNA A37 methylthiotransferase MiaB